MPAVLKGPTVTFPDAALVPFHALSLGLAVAVQDAGLLVALQVILLVAPVAMLVGLDEIVTTGTGCALTVMVCN